MRHPVEERLQRLLAILASIAGQGPVPLGELSDRFRVSPHQLRKDLTLAQYIGIPPYDLPGQTPEVIFRDDTVEVWVPPHFAAQPALTRPEAFAVLAAGRAAVEIDPQLDALRSAMDKLADRLELAGGVDVDIEAPTHLDTIRAAVDARHVLRISYWSAWRDELTDRFVAPVQVTFLDSSWYLLASDHQSDELRRFRVDRVVECTDTGNGFGFVSVGALPLVDVFEAPDFAVLVTVRFPAAADWVTEYVAMDVTEQDADGFTATVTSVGDVWLERLLLRTGGEVIEPGELVGLRQRAARRLLASYEAES